jgi:hypothetical protein
VPLYGLARLGPAIDGQGFPPTLFEIVFADIENSNSFDRCASAIGFGKQLDIWDIERQFNAGGRIQRRR